MTGVNVYERGSTNGSGVMGDSLNSKTKFGRADIDEYSYKNSAKSPSPQRPSKIGFTPNR